jgi:hypothetical protein
MKGEKSIKDVCLRLADEARQEWIKNDETTIDDITVQVMNYV